MNDTLSSYLPGLLAGNSLTRSEAEALLPHVQAELLDLMAAARLAASRGGSQTFTCAIVNAKSGRCSEDCAFCAQSRRGDGKATVQPLLAEDELVRRVETLAATGATYVGLVTAGARPAPAELDRLCRAAGRILARVDIKLCASIGMLSAPEARRLREAGFTSCHHNLETSRDHYPQVCTTHAFQERVDTVANAKAAGLRACSGGIFGVGERWEQRLDLFAELAKLGVDSIPVNFLIPIPGTPFESAKPPEPAEALAIVALLRLMHPGRDIVVCGGRTASLGRYGELILSAGANGIMIGDYLTAKGGSLAEDLAYLKTMGAAGGADFAKERV